MTQERPFDREAIGSTEPEATTPGPAFASNTVENPRAETPPVADELTNGVEPHPDDEFDDGEEEEYEDEYDEAEAGFVRFRTQAFVVGATILSVLILALIAGNVYQYIHNHNEQVVATVNGAPIMQREFNRADTSSQAVLDNLIATKLIDQEAAREKVTVPNSDIDSRLADIKKQVGSEQDFKDALQRNNLNESDLRSQIRTNLLAEKMGAKTVSVSDDEAQTYYNQNKANYGTQTYDQVKDQIKTQLLQPKQSEAIQTWIAGLRQKAKVVIRLPT